MDLRSISQSLNDFTFNVTIPSTGKKTKGRPYVLKDEFKISMAQKKSESDVLFLYDVIFDLIKEKYFELTEEEINSLTKIDVIYLLSNLKMNSDETEVKIKISCDYCEKQTPMTFSFSKFDLENEKNFKKDIKLSDNVMITMKVISLKDFVTISLNDSLSEEDKTKMILAKSLVQIIQGDEVKQSSEFEFNELVEFVSNIPKRNMKGINDFLNNQPSLKYLDKVICSNNDCREPIDIDVNDFFFLFL